MATVLHDAIMNPAEGRTLARTHTHTPQPPFDGAILPSGHLVELETQPKCHSDKQISL